MKNVKPVLTMCEIFKGFEALSKILTSSFFMTKNKKKKVNL